MQVPLAGSGLSVSRADAPLGYPADHVPEIRLGRPELTNWPSGTHETVENLGGSYAAM
jgi:hypothetical protein